MDSLRSNSSSPVELESPSSLSSSMGFQERRSFIKNNIPEEIRLFRRILNKITDDNRTYEGYLENILRIDVIKPDSDSENDKEIMLPIVASFLGMIYEDKETNSTIFLYGRLFIDLVQKWNGRQGKVLLSTMILKINEFIQDYHSHKISDGDLIEDVKRRRCFCILKFLYYIYDKNSDIIPGKIIMVIMEKFFPTTTPINELHLEVFLRLLTQNYSKLKDEKIFQVKLKEKYLNLLKNNINTVFSSRQYNYQIEDTMALF
jgi:hypothetical protein